MMMVVVTMLIIMLMIMLVVMLVVMSMNRRSDDFRIICVQITFILMLIITITVQMSNLRIHMIIFILKILWTMWMIMAMSRRPFI